MLLWDGKHITRLTSIGFFLPDADDDSKRPGLIPPLIHQVGSQKIN